MLLTKKSATTSTPQSRLARSLSGTLARTVDRRAFLKRSGVAVGAGAFRGELLAAGLSTGCRVACRRQGAVSMGFIAAPTRS